MSVTGNMKAEVSICCDLQEFPNSFIVLIYSFLEIFEEMLNNY